LANCRIKCINYEARNFGLKSLAHASRQTDIARQQAEQVQQRGLHFRWNGTIQIVPDLDVIQVGKFTAATTVFSMLVRRRMWKRNARAS
jgi:hypothetical protein